LRDERDKQVNEREVREGKGRTKAGHRALLGGVVNITKEPFGSLDSDTPRQYTS